MSGGAERQDRIFFLILLGIFSSPWDDLTFIIPYRANKWQGFPFIVR